MRRGVNSTSLFSSWKRKRLIRLLDLEKSEALICRYGDIFSVRVGCVCVCLSVCTCACAPVQGPASDCDDYFYWLFLLFSFGPRGCGCQRILLFMLMSNLKHTSLSESNPAFSWCLRKSFHLIEENVLLLILSFPVLKSNARLSYLIPCFLCRLSKCNDSDFFFNWFSFFFFSSWFYRWWKRLSEQEFLKLLFGCDIPAAQQNTTFENFNYNKGMYLISRLHRVPVI